VCVCVHLPGIPITQKKKRTDSRPIRRRDLAPKGQLTEALNGPFITPANKIPLEGGTLHQICNSIGTNGAFGARENDKGLPMIIRVRVIITIVRELGSGDNTVFSKVQVVHRLINDFLDFFPVAAPLYELVNILPGL
jgi:hypothetical protein